MPDGSGVMLAEFTPFSIGFPPAISIPGIGLNLGSSGVWQSLQVAILTRYAPYLAGVVLSGSETGVVTGRGIVCTRRANRNGILFAGKSLCAARTLRGKTTM